MSPHPVAWFVVFFLVGWVLPAVGFAMGQRRWLTIADSAAAAAAVLLALTLLVLT